MTKPTELKPGFNDPSWSSEFQCTGVITRDLETRYGCGTLFLITREHLYRVSGQGGGRRGCQPRICFFCQKCGVETDHPHPLHFESIIDRDEWFKVNHIDDPNRVETLDSTVYDDPFRPG